MLNLPTRIRSWLRALEVVFAVLFLFLWLPTFEPVADVLSAPLESFVSSPLLFTSVLPGLLCLVALVGAVADGWGISTFAVGVLVGFTSLMIVWDVAVVLFHTGGGVHVAPLLIFLSGTPLAVVVLLRATLVIVFPDGVTTVIRGWRSNL